MRTIAIALLLMSCFPRPTIRAPEVRPRVALKPIPRIAGATDIGFTAGLLAERGFTITMASRDANVVSTDWHPFLIDGTEGVMQGRERVQVSATDAGILVQYTAICLVERAVPTDAMYGPTVVVKSDWEQCRELTPHDNLVSRTLTARNGEIWSAIRDAAHAAAAAANTPAE